MHARPVYLRIIINEVGGWESETSRGDDTDESTSMPMPVMILMFSRGYVKYEMELLNVKCALIMIYLYLFAECM